MARTRAIRNGWCAVLAGWLCAAAAFAQQPRSPTAPFTELRRWRWQSPEVVCGAADAAGTIAALGRRDPSGNGWHVMVWDPAARAELRSVPVAKRPVAMRFPDRAHVEVRLADTDAFFSLSHWHRFRIADGAAVGEPTLSRVEDDDVAARKRMRGESLFGDTTMPGPGPCVFREPHAVSWWKDGVTLPIADFAVHRVELTPDGRFAAVWLPSRLVAIPVAGGDPRVLPVASETIRAIDAGANGDELVVVTADAVRLFRVAATRETSNVRFDGEHVVDAALAPDGSKLAIAARNAPVVLLDLVTERAHEAALRAIRVAWTLDGRRLAGGGSQVGPDVQRFVGPGMGAGSVDADGRFVAEGRPADDRWIHAHLSFDAPGGTHLVALDGDDAWSWLGQTTRITPVGKDSEGPTSVPFMVREQLSPRELVATDGMRLRLCDAKSWESLADFDLRASAGVLGVARAARRVAVVAGPELVVLDVAPRK